MCSALRQSGNNSIEEGQDRNEDLNYVTMTMFNWSARVLLQALSSRREGGTVQRTFLTIY